MNYKIIGLIIIIIIVIIIISKEHLEILGDAHNNFVNNFNSKNLNLDKLNISEELNINDKTIKDYIINITYPVDSIFITNKKYELKDNKPSEITNSPLDYGKWEEVNDKDDYLTLGLTPKEAKKTGDKKILLKHLPNHAHKGLTGFYGWNDSGDYRMPADQRGWGGGVNSVWYVYTGNEIGTSNGFNFTLRGEQKDFIPYGYYLFAYKRIE